MNYRSVLIALLLSTAVALRSVDARNGGFKLFDRQQNSEGRGRLLIGRFGAMTSTTIAPSELLVTSGPPAPTWGPSPTTPTWGPTTSQTTSFTPTLRSAGTQGSLGREDGQENKESKRNLAGPPPTTAPATRSLGEKDRDIKRNLAGPSPATPPTTRYIGAINKESIRNLAGPPPAPPPPAPTARSLGEKERDIKRNLAGPPPSPATTPTTPATSAAAGRNYEEEDFNDVNESVDDDDDEEDSLLAHDNEEINYVSARENSLAKAVGTIRIRPNQIKRYKAGIIPNRRQQNKRKNLQKQQKKKRVFKNQTVNNRPKQSEAQNLKRFTKKQLLQQRRKNKLRNMQKQTLKIHRRGLRRSNSGRRSHIVRIEV